MIYENCCSYLLVGQTVKRCRQCFSKLQSSCVYQFKDPDACFMIFLALDPFWLSCLSEVNGDAWLRCFILDHRRGKGIRI